MTDRESSQPDDIEATKLRTPASDTPPPAPDRAETRIRPRSAQLTIERPGRLPEPGINGPSGQTGVGRVLAGRYRLDRELGAGGMGTVYLASDQEVAGETFAIKLLRAGVRERPEALELVREEVRKTRLLAHPNVVGMYSVNVDQCDVFILMEYLEGKSLRALLDDDFGRGMPFDRAWPLIRGMCSGLAYAHDHNVVHSDLKPSNVFVTISGKAKLLDFGIARASRGHSGRFDPAILGALTPAYASCEMLEGGEPDQRDDLYSLACVIYEMLSGEHPFSCLSAVEARDTRRGFKPIATLTRAQNSALVKALSFDRATRTQTVESLLEELGGVAPAHPNLLFPTRRALTLGVLLFAAIGVAVAAVLWRYVKVTPDADRPPLATASTPAAVDSDPSGLIPTAKAASLLRLLGIDPPLRSPDGAGFGAQAMLALLKAAPRHVSLGSSAQQIDAAFVLCKQYASDCRREWFSDEVVRSALLRPFVLDPFAVSVGDFRTFVATSNYRTNAEVGGIAYTAINGRLTPVKGGSWRNAVGTSSPADVMAVVGVDYRDAEVYCRGQGKRLPTEDEREYIARGPEGHIYPWGDDPGPAVIRSTQQPVVTEGPPEGIGGTYRGLSGAVWEWVSTEVDSRKVLKGGAWAETNPANKRAATRGYELPNRANGSTGFRCALTVTDWPDAAYWMDQLR